MAYQYKRDVTLEDVKAAAAAQLEHLSRLSGQAAVKYLEMSAFEIVVLQGAITLADDLVKMVLEEDLHLFKMHELCSYEGYHELSLAQHILEHTPDFRTDWR